MINSQQKQTQSKFVEFLGYDCNVVVNRYAANKQPALQLVAADTQNNAERDTFPGEPIITASVCLPDVILAPGETVLKDYSEGEGVLAALVAANIVSDTGKRIGTGFVEVPVVKLL